MRHCALIALFFSCVSFAQAKVQCEIPTNKADSCCSRCYKRFNDCEAREGNSLASESKCYSLYAECSEKCEKSKPRENSHQVEE